MNSCDSSLLSTWGMAGATVGILFATIVYACFTKRLWQQTKRAAEQSENQFAVVREQVSLARHEVELRVRPYLKITAGLGTDGPRREGPRRGAALRLSPGPGWTRPGFVA